MNPPPFLFFFPLLFATVLVSLNVYFTRINHKEQYITNVTSLYHLKAISNSQFRTVREAKWFLEEQVFILMQLY